MVESIVAVPHVSGHRSYISITINIRFYERIKCGRMGVALWDSTSVHMYNLTWGLNLDVNGFRKNIFGVVMMHVKRVSASCTTPIQSWATRPPFCPTHKPILRLTHRKLKCMKASSKKWPRKYVWPATTFSLKLSTQETQSGYPLHTRKRTHSQNISISFLWICKLSFC